MENLILPCDMCDCMPSPKYVEGDSVRIRDNGEIYTVEEVAIEIFYNMTTMEVSHIIMYYLKECGDFINEADLEIVAIHKCECCGSYGIGNESDNTMFKGKLTDPVTGRQVLSCAKCGEPVWISEKHNLVGVTCLKCTQNR